MVYVLAFSANLHANVKFKKKFNVNDTGANAATRIQSNNVVHLNCGRVQMSTAW